MARGSRINIKEERRRNEMLSMREPVHYCCEGCGKVEPEDKSLCTIYINPDALWNRGGCFLATHMSLKTAEQAGKTRVGQQKQSKKKSRKK